VDHELAVRAKCLQQGLAPASELRVVLAKQLAYEALETLR
jgi:hypothetical protein